MTLAPLAGLTHLEQLDVSGTEIADLIHQSCAALAQLYLSATKVTDLTPLKGLSGLTLSILAGTDVADIAPLAGLAALKSVDLAGTKIDKAALARLNQDRAAHGLGPVDLPDARWASFLRRHRSKRMPPSADLPGRRRPEP